MKWSAQCPGQLTEPGCDAEGPVGEELNMNRIAGFMGSGPAPEVLERPLTGPLRGLPRSCVPSGGDVSQRPL